MSKKYAVIADGEHETNAPGFFCIVSKKQYYDSYEEAVKAKQNILLGNRKLHAGIDSLISTAGKPPTIAEVIEVDN